jgi:hypothetical protein
VYICKFMHMVVLLGPEICSEEVVWSSVESSSLSQIVCCQGHGNLSVDIV